MLDAMCVRSDVTRCCQAREREEQRREQELRGATFSPTLNARSRAIATRRLQSQWAADFGDGGTDGGTDVVMSEGDDVLPPPRNTESMDALDAEIQAAIASEEGEDDEVHQRTALAADVDSSAPRGSEKEGGPMSGAGSREEGDGFSISIIVDAMQTPSSSRTQHGLRPPAGGWDEQVSPSSPADSCFHTPSTSPRPFRPNDLLLNQNKEVEVGVATSSDGLTPLSVPSVGGVPSPLSASSPNPFPLDTATMSPGARDGAAPVPPATQSIPPTSSSSSKERGLGDGQGQQLRRSSKASVDAVSQPRSQQQQRAQAMGTRQRAASPAPGMRLSPTTSSGVGPGPGDTRSSIGRQR